MTRLLVLAVCLAPPLCVSATMGPIEYRVSGSVEAVTVCSPKAEAHDCTATMLREGPDGSVVALDPASCEATEHEVCFTDTCLEIPGRYRYGFQTPYPCGTHSYVAWYGEAELPAHEERECTPRHPVRPVTTETKPWRDDPAYCDYMPHTPPPVVDPGEAEAIVTRVNYFPAVLGLLGILVLIGVGLLVRGRSRVRLEDD